MRQPPKGEWQTLGSLGDKEPGPVSRAKPEASQGHICSLIPILKQEKKIIYMHLKKPISSDYL